MYSIYLVSPRAGAKIFLKIFINNKLIEYIKYIPLKNYSLKQSYTLKKKNKQRTKEQSEAVNFIQ